VLKEMRSIVDDWYQPKNFNSLSKNPMGLAKDFTDGAEIKSLGLDPATATSHDYLMSWVKTFRSPTGITDLKRKLSSVYTGYEQQGKYDNMAKKAAAEVVGSVNGLLSSRYGKAYKDVQAGYGADMQTLRKVREIFGQKDETAGRRITSVVRDTAFTDFGTRLKTLEDFIKRVGVATQNKGVANPTAGLKAVAAGRTARAVQPRNMIGLAGAGGLGTITTMATNLPLGVVVFFAHTPRLVGETAYGLGKAEGMIARPLKAVVNAVRNTVGITPRGAAQGGALAGMAADRNQSREHFKNILRQEAEKSGYRIHPRVLDTAVNHLVTDDVDTFMRGLRTVNGHKRLMELLVKIGGTKGEQ
jgi:hypothetical protein